MKVPCEVSNGSEKVEGGVALAMAGKNIIPIIAPKSRTMSAPSLPILCRPIAFLIGCVLAHKLAVLGAAEVPFALKVIDVRVGVYPYDPIARAAHAGRWLMEGRLGERHPSSNEKRYNSRYPGEAGNQFQICNTLARRVYRLDSRVCCIPLASLAISQGCGGITNSRKRVFPFDNRTCLA